MDLDVESFNFLEFLDSRFLDFQVPRFPKSGPGRAWALGRAGLGPWALGQVGPRGEWAILRLDGPSCDRMVHPATVVHPATKNGDASDGF